MEKKLLSMLKKYNREVKTTAGALAIVVLAMAALAGYEILKKTEVKEESVEYTGLLTNLASRNINSVKENSYNPSWSDGYKILTDMVKANAFAESGEYDKTIALLEDAKKIAKDDVIKEMIVINLSNAILSNAKSDQEKVEAKSKALDILAEAKDSPVALEMRGDILITDGKYVEGVDMYNKAFSLLNAAKANTTSINAKINYYSQYL